MIKAVAPPKRTIAEQVYPKLLKMAQPEKRKVESECRNIPDTEEFNLIKALSVRSPERSMRAGGNGGRNALFRDFGVSIPRFPGVP